MHDRQNRNIINDPLQNVIILTLAGECYMHIVHISAMHLNGK